MESSEDDDSAVDATRFESHNLTRSQPKIRSTNPSRHFRSKVQTLVEEEEEEEEEEAEDLDFYGDRDRFRKRRKIADFDSDQSGWTDSEGENAGAAAYRKFKAQRPEARKKALAATRKAKAIDAENNPAPRSRNRDTTGVGKQAAKSKPKRKVQDFDDESEDEASMEWTVPDYVQERRAKFNERSERLKEAGLMLPPTYDEVHFSDDDRLRTLKERPDFLHARILGPYQDIELPYSLGVIPASIAQHLRDYQVKGAAFLHELFVYQKGGILGDDMGLGKTIQVIAFLTAAYGKTGDERDKKRMRKMRRTGKPYPRTLIICPGSLMSNWQEEFNRWGWWHTDLFHGSMSQKQDVLDTAKSGMLEVMITTYTTYRLNKSAINMISWDCIVADECHVIKERKAEITKAMNEVNALCRIGLTGTAIQNKYDELWCLLNWTSPGRFGPISTWKVSVSEPLKLGQSHNATVYELARARKTAKKLVDNLLPQFFLRRMKTLIKDQLPKKTDRVVFCPLTEAQADAYQNFLDSDAIQAIKQSGEMCECGSGKKAGWCHRMQLENGDPWQAWVFPCIAYLQRLSNHLALLIPQGTDTKEKQAKDLDMLQTAVPAEWQKLYETRDSLINYSNPEFCGKWRILRKLLKFWYEQGSNKVLVFSHSVRLLKMLQALFISTSYNVKYLDGSMSYDDRYITVREFNTDPTHFVFLISTRAGGVGLNITSANKVVVVDPNWNPSYDLQAQDRAYRIGQTRDVEVFRLVSQGTLEEIVYARQIYKQQQASIGYNASSERRYFQGVQDRKEQKGELFGLENLFAYQDENVVLRDIVHKTNVAESRADIRVANLNVEDDSDGYEAESYEDDILKNDDDPARSMKTETGNEDAAMSQLAAEITGEADQKGRRGQKTRPKQSRSNKFSNSMSFASNSSGSSAVEGKRYDPIQAILASAGVSYTHENSEVIGSSRVEAELSRRAEKADVRQQRALVFEADSQSQDQSQSSKKGYDTTRAFSQTGATNPNSQSDLETDVEFRYRYRPPEDVKRRQFCSMAQWAGYGVHVAEFAVVVEKWTQAERRECLEKFYQWRRYCLVHGIKSDVLESDRPNSANSKVDESVRQTPSDSNLVVGMNTEHSNLEASDFNRVKVEESAFPTHAEPKELAGDRTKSCDMTLSVNEDHQEEDDDDEDDEL